MSDLKYIMRKDVKILKKTKIELLSEKMGVVFSAPEDMPSEAAEEVIEYDE